MVGEEIMRLLLSAIAIAVFVVLPMPAEARVDSGIRGTPEDSQVIQVKGGFWSKVISVMAKGGSKVGKPPKNMQPKRICINPKTGQGYSC
jgi:hypothetical protein